MARRQAPKANPWAPVAREVRDTRTRRGWTQQVLAVKADVSLSTVTAFETLKRQNYQLGKVAPMWRALGLPHSELNRLLEGGGGVPVDDPAVQQLRDDVEASGLSDRIKQTILTLIDSELPHEPGPRDLRRSG